MTEKNMQIPEHGANIARNLIPENCKWQVQHIYNDRAAWQKACEDFKSKLPILSSMQNKLETATAVADALALQDELSRMLDKIYAYARLQQDADNTDQHMQAFPVLRKHWPLRSATPLPL